MRVRDKVIVTLSLALRHAPQPLIPPAPLGNSVNWLFVANEPRSPRGTHLPVQDPTHQCVPSIPPRTSLLRRSKRHRMLCMRRTPETQLRGRSVQASVPAHSGGVHASQPPEIWRSRKYSYLSALQRDRPSDRPAPSWLPNRRLAQGRNAPLARPAPMWSRRYAHSPPASYGERRHEQDEKEHQHRWTSCDPTARDPSLQGSRKRRAPHC